MNISRSVKLVRKAKASMLAAIEVFNKPSISFREEAFSLLALTAWELLLKAKIVRDAGNRLEPIIVWEPVPLKSGKAGRRKRPVPSRSGNPRTIDLRRAMGLIDSNSATRLPDPVRDNLLGLMEVRDNACHFYNADDELAGLAVRFGMACVNNFVVMTKEWFALDFSDDLTLLMAIGFVGAPRRGVGVALGSGADLVRCLKALATSGAKEVDGTVVVLEMEVIARKGLPGSGHVIRYSNDPKDPALQLSQEDIKKNWPHTYKTLVGTCRKRYTDYLENAKFHALMLPLKKDPKYHFVNRLDPDNPKSAWQDRYNGNVFQILDAAYTRAKA